MRPRSETGIALLTTMMVMLLLSSLLVGFGVMVASDNQLAAGDLGRTEAFYAGQAGLEKLTSDLGALFVTTPTPTGDQVRALLASPPLLPNTEFVKPDGSAGYEITFPSTTGDPATGDPITTELTVASGPFDGLIGRVTSYTLTVTVQKGEGAEASLERLVQTVSMPIFEFGVFSTQDITLFPDQAFTLNGRVHTNFNLFAATNGGPLRFANRISAVAEVVRTDLPNGYPVDAWSGDVEVTTAPGVYRALAANEGSLVDTLGSALNEPTWFNLSTGTYNSRIINRRTGARPLQLPVSLLPNGQPIDIIRRPIPGETTGAPLFPERHFSQASVRILLSDDITDLTSLPGVTGAPVNLGLSQNPLGPWFFATSKEGFDQDPPDYAGGEGYRFAAGTSLLGGYLKIEMQTTPGTWIDVTTEILNLGTPAASSIRPTTAGCRFHRRCRSPPTTGPTCCTTRGRVWSEKTPARAICRAWAASCTTSSSTSATWPCGSPVRSPAPAAPRCSSSDRPGSMTTAISSTSPTGGVTTTRCCWRPESTATRTSSTPGGPASRTLSTSRGRTSTATAPWRPMAGW